MRAKKVINDAVCNANRANAKQSTGPKTEKGKSIASRNASKHRILAKKVLLNSDEDRLSPFASRK